MAPNTIILYHNPRCSKSRAALALLQVRDIKTKVIPYLTEPLSREQIQTLIRQLGITSARAMMRTNEPEYQTLDLAHADEEKLIGAW
ncbi:ArsC/Spx/MgsR family protein [Snodgrassella sp. CFCC 13594]|uniref:ArsC/Spx/MgsR family protein n=1 Tax=Snodgrassella sp. CFCC 13594 TaxID=1775559 RepID=UPI000B1914DB|nr:ArsC/Spx/MgsR family protein [Snodgrassella sp. CFCC 13594]